MWEGDSLKVLKILKRLSHSPGELRPGMGIFSSALTDLEFLYAFQKSVINIPCIFKQ